MVRKKKKERLRNIDKAPLNNYSEVHLNEQRITARSQQHIKQEFQWVRGVWLEGQRGWQDLWRNPGSALWLNLRVHLYGC